MLWYAVRLLPTRSSVTGRMAARLVKGPRSAHEGPRGTRTRPGWTSLRWSDAATRGRPRSPRPSLVPRSPPSGPRPTPSSERAALPRSRTLARAPRPVPLRSSCRAPALWPAPHAQFPSAAGPVAAQFNAWPGTRARFAGQARSPTSTFQGRASPLAERPSGRAKIDHGPRLHPAQVGGPRGAPPPPPRRHRGSAGSGSDRHLHWAREHGGRARQQDAGSAR